MESEAIAKTVEHRANLKLGLRVAATDARHDSTSFGWAEDIGHGRGMIAGVGSRMLGAGRDLVLPRPTSDDPHPPPFDSLRSSHGSSLSRGAALAGEGMDPARG